MKHSPHKLFRGKWQQCYEHYLQDLYNRSQSENTIREYDYALARFFGDKRNPNQYSRQDVENYLNLPTTGPRGTGGRPMPRTRNYRLLVVRSFYSYAKTYSVSFRSIIRPILRVPDPTVGIKLGRFAEAERDMSAEEVRAFFGAIPRDTLIGLRDRAIFLCLFLTSRRRKEVAQLRWADLEQVGFQANGYLRQGWVYRWRGKGHASRDDIEEMPPPAMEAIKAYLQKADRWDTMRPADALFIGLFEDREQAITCETIDRRFRLYAEMAGIPKVVNVHSLRYAAAYEYYIESGKDLVAVQRRLRHKDPKTTERYVTPRRHARPTDEIATRIYERFAQL